jgi:hypothetical protein
VKGLLKTEWKDRPLRRVVAIEMGVLLGDVRVGGYGIFFFFGGSLSCSTLSTVGELAFVCVDTLFFLFGGSTATVTLAFRGAFTVFLLVAFGVVGVSFNLNWVGNFLSPSLFNNFK